MRTMRDAIFLIGKGRFLELLLFQPREQLRYNGVRKVRAVRAVRTEEMALLLRKTAECCQTSQNYIKLKAFVSPPFGTNALTFRAGFHAFLFLDVVEPLPKSNGTRSDEHLISPKSPPTYSSARPDLCGGCREIDIPTATMPRST
jgi:hypothetical protein